MCGIVGSFGSADTQIIASMLAATRHRGPDETKFRAWDRCVLGINRLSIVDVEHGHQLLSNGRGDVHVVCNGEIYNHAALRADLELSKHFRTKSDVEVIAHLYEDLGEDCVEQLDGMFAFVLYDERNHKFLAARDRFGIKPLFYIHDGARWYFASEIKGLVDTGADLEKVQLLPPGCYLTEAGVHCYYDLGTRRKRSVADPALLYSLLDGSVRRHLMADSSVKIGSFLSGGIDSSLVTALAAKYRPDIIGFTVGMEGSPDVAAAAKVCKHLGIEHVVVPFTLAEAQAATEHAVYQMETYNPMIISEGIIQMMLSKVARDRGIKVMMSGEGADEILAGYGVYRGKPPDEVHRMLRASVADINNTECRRLDRSTMAYSVEARVPFLDPMVVEYAINLPATAMVKDDGERRVEKWILRKACEDLLPPEIVWRMKLSFDQGSGILRILEHINARISDAELKEAQKEFPHAELASKSALHFYRIFCSYFGKMGGANVYPLFGRYATLQAAINIRTHTSGGTGEDTQDMARLNQVTGRVSAS